MRDAERLREDPADRGQGEGLLHRSSVRPDVRNPERSLADSDSFDVRRSLQDDTDDRHGFVGEMERPVVDPEEPGFRLHYISFRPPVTWSTIAFGPGPIPKQVTVPGGSSVRPASSTSAVVSPIDRALVRRAWRSARVPTFTTTFFWPSAHHSANHFR